MKTKAKVAIGIGAFLAISVSGLAITILNPGGPNFRFLDGRPLIISGELPLMEDVPHGDDFRNCWVYSWEEDWNRAYGEMDHELNLKGFRVKIDHGDASWTRKDGTSVALMHGQVRNKRDLERGPVGRAGWINVGIVEPAPDTWLAHLRLVMSPF